MGDNRKYGLQATLVAKQGMGSELSDILMQAAELMKTAKGCYLYAVGLNFENEDEVCISEIWSSKETHDASLNLPGVRELISLAMPILAVPPKKGNEIHILGGQGLD